MRPGNNQQRRWKLNEVIALLLEAGWTEDGATQAVAYKTASPAYGGGSVVKLGGRKRLQKGRWKVTVGKRTTCFYRKPEQPETSPGAGRLAGQRVYTFKDWEQVNIATKDVAGIQVFLQQIDSSK